jgi:hypothetical protein
MSTIAGEVSGAANDSRGEIRGTVRGDMRHADRTAAIRRPTLHPDVVLL